MKMKSFNLVEAVSSVSETTPGNLRVGGDFNDPLSASGNLEYSDG